MKIKYHSFYWNYMVRPLPSISIMTHGWKPFGIYVDFWRWSVGLILSEDKDLGEHIHD
jgi:hypothetical protein